MYVLGINSVYHESAACLLENGRLVGMVEEERFSRIKHAKTPQADNPDILPLHAIRYCCDLAGIDISQVDYIGYSSSPDNRAKLAENQPFEMVEFEDNIRAVPNVLEMMGFRGEFRFIDHHLAHAASAFYASPFDDAAVLSVDGIGDATTTAGYHGHGTQLDEIWSVPSPHSIGFLWELMSMFLGFGIYDATKIMGLSAYGDSKRFREKLDQLIFTQDGGQFRVDTKATKFYKLDYIRQTGYFRGFEQLFGIKKRKRNEELEQVHYDLAAALQDVTDDVLLHIVKELQRLSGSKNLCLSGGVALNCVSNARTFNNGPYDDMYIQPAAHDAGTAIGCATYIWHQELGRERTTEMPHAYVGAEFTDAQIEESLKRHNLNYRKCENIEQEVAKLISESEIVGWLQGRMEAGPRALGNRSLLADPRHPNMRDILNEKVKHREFFRPFAPSVLIEEARNWFQIGKATSADEMMLMAYPAQEDKRQKIPAVIHADGTSRIQSVRSDSNPRYHRMISEFQKLTGVPIVLNTSFNDSEPIVCSPDDAIDTFLKTNIDNLAMGNYLIRKVDNKGAKRLPNDRLAPTMHKVFPEMASNLERAVGTRRVSRMNDLLVITDAISYGEPDQVLPLFPEQQFFIDEMPAERIEGASVLEVGIGSGILSMTMAKARAKKVTALEINPRAKILAGFNILMNGYEQKIEIRDGDDEVFRPVQGERFDFLLSNPPFMPASPEGGEYLHSSAGIYGLDFCEKLFKGMDQVLTEDGYAQFVTLAPGNEKDGPFLMNQMIDRYTRGKTVVKLARETSEFDYMGGWMLDLGTMDEQQVRTVLEKARKDGITHSYLCVIHYERSGKKGIEVETIDRDYPHWSIMAPGAVLWEAKADKKLA